MSNETGAIAPTARTRAMPAPQDVRGEGLPESQVKPRVRPAGIPVVPKKDAAPDRRIFSTGADTPASHLSDLARAVQARWGGSVAVLPQKPPRGFQQHAIWPSSTGQGYGVHLPEKSLHVRDFDRAVRLLETDGVAPDQRHAAQLQLAARISARWGDAVDCVASAPPGLPARPAIWNSTIPSILEMMLPDGKKYQFEDLADAAKIFLQYGVMTVEQRQAQQFAADVQARWGGRVDVREDAPAPDSDRPAIWHSVTSPGKLSLYVPEGSYATVANLDEAVPHFRSHGVLTSAEREHVAAHKRFKNEVRALWDGQVSARKTRPHGEPGRPAVWPSVSAPGHFGLRYPNGKMEIVEDLQAAATKLARYGIAARMDSGTDT